MSRPEGLTDEQWNDVIEDRYLVKQRQNHLKRIKTEGFELSSFDVDGATCERATHRKIKNRWGTEPCGKPALVTLTFAGPQNPEGIPVALCRGCLGQLTKDLIGHLDI